jgi:hypothetical protein
MNSIERISSEIDSLTVPPFQFSAVRSRAQVRHPKPRRRIIAAATLAVLMPALAAAAVHFFPARVVELPNGTLHIYGDTEYFRNPTAAQLSAVGRKASYRVTWPLALPAGTRVKRMLVAGSAVMFMNYACPRGGFLQFIIFPTNAQPESGLQKLPLRLSLTPTSRTYDFTAGAERVRLETNCLTGMDIARIRSAMSAAGAATP